MTPQMMEMMLPKTFMTSFKEILFGCRILTAAWHNHILSRYAFTNCHSVIITFEGKKSRKEVLEEDSKNVLLPCVVLIMSGCYVRSVGAVSGSRDVTSAAVCVSLSGSVSQEMFGGGCELRSEPCEDSPERRVRAGSPACSLQRSGVRPRREPSSRSFTLTMAPRRG